MSACTTYPEIADHIRVKVVYEGLELEDVGLEIGDLTDEVRLFDEEGLNLDSIDALEIIVGVQREFGVFFPDVDQAFIKEHCATIASLARTVEDWRRREPASPASPSHRGRCDP